MLGIPIAGLIGSIGATNGAPVAKETSTATATKLQHTSPTKRESRGTEVFQPKRECFAGVDNDPLLVSDLLSPSVARWIAQFSNFFSL